MGISIFECENSGTANGFNWYIVKGKMKRYMLVDVSKSVSLPEKHCFQFTMKLGGVDGILSMDYSYRLKEAMSRETRCCFMGMYFPMDYDFSYMCFHSYMGKKAEDEILDDVVKVTSEISSVLIKKDMLGGWCEIDDEIIGD